MMLYKCVCWSLLLMTVEHIDLTCVHILTARPVSEPGLWTDLFAKGSLDTAVDHTKHIFDEQTC